MQGRVRGMALLLVLWGCADKTDWCVDQCKALGDVIAVPGGPSDFDHAAYDAGCEALEARSCDDCNRVLGEYLMETADHTSDCYCTVKESERDPSVVSSEECDAIVSDFYGGDASELERTCSCT